MRMGPEEKRTNNQAGGQTDRREKHSKGELKRSEETKADRQEIDKKSERETDAISGQ